MLTIVSQFTTGLNAVGLGYDSTRDELLVYRSFGTQVDRFSSAGTSVGLFASPGETANDYDIDFVDASLRLAGVRIAAGAALLFNGENGVAEIRAVDPVTGTVLATLVTEFGASHVVGGAYHADRGTFFLVQDRVPGGADANRVAEIDARTGAVLNTFVISSSASFTVNYGDLEVEPVTGELMIVSSDESRILRLSPEGVVLGTLDLPNLGGLSGIAFIPDSPNEGYVTSTDGQVTRLSGFLGDNVTIGEETRDTVTGTDGDETIVGLGGNDAIRAQAGNDRVYGGNGRDSVLGLDGDDYLDGGNQGDKLNGGRGADILVGGAGNDQLIGGIGTDILTGGSGADIFRFGRADVENSLATADLITDFSRADGDTINLAAIDAIAGRPAGDNFTFIGTAAFSGTAGELRYEFSAGETLILGDLDGGGTADLVIRLTGVVDLVAADFDLGDNAAAPGVSDAVSLAMVAVPMPTILPIMEVF